MGLVRIHRLENEVVVEVNAYIVWIALAHRGPRPIRYSVDNHVATLLLVDAFSPVVLDRVQIQLCSVPALNERLRTIA